MGIFSIFQGKEGVPSYEILSARDKKHYLEDLSTAGQFDKIGELPGFLIIDKHPPSNGRDDVSDCIDYAFGGLDKMRVTNPSEISSDEVQSGDAVIYFDEGGHPTHAARITNFPMVRSKFGAGYVYEHLMTEVPSSYLPDNGTMKFYRILEN